jgi:hypothetical protein
MVAALPVAVTVPPVGFAVSTKIESVADAEVTLPYTSRNHTETVREHVPVIAKVLVVA